MTLTSSRDQLDLFAAGLQLTLWESAPARPSVAEREKQRRSARQARADRLAAAAERRAAAAEALAARATRMGRRARALQDRAERIEDDEEARASRPAVTRRVERLQARVRAAARRQQHERHAALSEELEYWRGRLAALKHDQVVGAATTTRGGRT